MSEPFNSEWIEKQKALLVNAMADKTGDGLAHASYVNAALVNYPLVLDLVDAQRAEIERLRTIVQDQEDLLNAILQPGERWLELRRDLRDAGEDVAEWFSEHGDSLGLAEQRVVEAIKAALNTMVKK